MFLILLFFMMIVVISGSVMSLALMLAKKNMPDEEKCSPFECGFDSFSSSRNPFSIKFFNLTVLFLVFDIELGLMIPMVKVFVVSMPLSWAINSFILCMILIVGIVHEWNQGMLNWVN